jgi:hypothetical protein
MSGNTAVLVCLAAFILAFCLFEPRWSEAAQSGATWRFAVSGDSRNCGDVVMPAIAAGAAAHEAAFFWHLGDFRAMYSIDEDFADQTKNPVTLDEYGKRAWQGFIENQLNAFGKTPVFLAIGNHELARNTRADYIAKFGKWLSAPEIARQRLADDSSASPQTYYHWIMRGIDFITMDSASDDQFDAAQMVWFEKVLGQDESNPGIRAVVVGMHKALPDSISKGHSMSESGNDVPVEAGRRVYRDLLAAQRDFNKKVYILASHSHYYMDGVFNTDFWKDNILPGWIVGTAGALRYQLPEDWGRAHQAIQGAYGYLLATVEPDAGDGHAADGTIRFEFQLINKSDVPGSVRRKFTPGLVDFCFDQNMLQPN